MNKIEELKIEDLYFYKKEAEAMKIKFERLLPRDRQLLHGNFMATHNAVTMDEKEYQSGFNYWSKIYKDLETEFHKRIKDLYEQNEKETK